MQACHVPGETRWHLPSERERVRLGLVPFLSQLPRPLVSPPLRPLVPPLPPRPLVPSSPCPLVPLVVQVSRHKPVRPRGLSLMSWKPRLPRVTDSPCWPPQHSPASEGTWDDCVVVLLRQKLSWAAVVSSSFKPHSQGLAQAPACPGSQPVYFFEHGVESGQAGIVSVQRQWPSCAEPKQFRRQQRGLESVCRGFCLIEALRLREQESKLILLLFSLRRKCVCYTFGERNRRQGPFPAAVNQVPVYCVTLGVVSV